MPTLTHESLVNMFRVRPALAVDLLRTTFGVAVPEFERVSVAEADATEAVPVEFRADLVVELWARDAQGVERRVLVIVLEAQLATDDDKTYTWPVYASVMRARRRCPAYVLVVTLDVSVAAWASRAIEVSPGLGTWRPLVLGPVETPRVDDPKYAQAHPELAVMSTAMHANTDARGEALVRAIPAALHVLDAESGRAYFLMLKQVLKPALRALIERLMIEKTPYGEFEVPAWLHKAEQAARDEGREKGREEGREKGREEGRAEGREEGREEGLARSVLTVLSTRGLVPTDAERTKVLACRDERRLERWLRKAVTARSVAAVLKPAQAKKK